ncbi:beta-1,4-galactosyltransferase 7-like [Tigriopus californicus]|uniref:beta-1,4-galactosyltransferase 7-like n=1 Tax=Tigriopus californicus TaxID=6832 RepID=UPI0027DA4A84|nr:beta-1,4-galactosyltransferase 7-like [Tigriopus californicus]
MARIVFIRRRMVYALLSACLTLLILSWMARSSTWMSDSHQLCFLVPFRDRFDELSEFVPHLSRFLSSQNVPFRMFVLNQIDEFRFNRGALLNAGFDFVSRNTDCDYVALHDVDLYPMNPGLDYGHPGTVVRHLAAPGLHPKYDYPNFLGGIVLIGMSTFRSVNGLTNNFWGWGLEDDDFRARLQEAGIVIERPEGLTSGTTQTFKHHHTQRRRPRDYRRCYNQRDFTRRRDRNSGLSNLEYELTSHRKMTVDGFAFDVLSLKLVCDKKLTPFCDCHNAPVEESPIRPVPPEDKIVPQVKPKRTVKTL